MFYSSLGRRFFFMFLAGGGLIACADTFFISSAEFTDDASAVFGGQAGSDCPGCALEDPDFVEECFRLY